MNNDTCLKNVGWTSVAVNAIVMLIVLMVIIFCIPVYAVIVKDGHSLSNALYPQVRMFNMHCFFGEY
jgi:hypothetical protein